jgi:hypothetical protein
MFLFAGALGVLLGAIIGIGTASDGTPIHRGLALGGCIIVVVTVSVVVAVDMFTGTAIWELFGPAGVAFAAMLPTLPIANAAAKRVLHHRTRLRSKNAA